MIPLDEAVAIVLDGCRPLAPRTVPVGEAVGCVLAEDVVAAEALPPFANSAMDGYAVRAADVATVPAELPVVAEVAAGHPAARALAPGEAMRIFTGAPLPDGADAVVMVEHTDRLDGGGRVAIHRAAAPDDHVRPAGDDVRPGDRVLTAGETLTAGGLGLLRSLGAERVAIHPRPRVGVLSTGDELVEGTGPLRPGQIRDSNRPTLLALIGPAGGVPVDLGHADDDEAAITAALTRAAEECDVVLSTGGVSMGDTDLVKVVLDRLARDGVRWLQVAIKPAKPLAFGVAGEREVPVLGLPGNPVSSMVSFELFARPALRRRAGHPDDRLSRAALTAVAAEPLPRRADGKLHLVRVVAELVDGELRVGRAGLGQGSHQLSAMARANALALVPDGPGVEAGAPVQVLLLDELHSRAPAG
jgi:molybdopterin molybdotransferase